MFYNCFLRVWLFCKGGSREYNVIFLCTVLQKSCKNKNQNRKSDDVFRAKSCFVTKKRLWNREFETKTFNRSFRPLPFLRLRAWLPFSPFSPPSLPPFHHLQFAFSTAFCISEAFVRGADCSRAGFSVSFFSSGLGVHTGGDISTESNAVQICSS